MREGHQPHLAVGQQRLQPGGVEMAGLRVDLPFADLDPFVGEAAPGAGIGLVILVGDDDGGVLVAQPHAGGVGEHEGVGRGRGAEGELLFGAIHQLREAGAGLVHLGTGGLGAGKGAVGLDLAFEIEAVEAVDHGAGGVGAAGVFEEGVGFARRGRRRPGTGRGKRSGRVRSLGPPWRAKRPWAGGIGKPCRSGFLRVAARAPGGGGYAVCGGGRAVSCVAPGRAACQCRDFKSATAGVPPAPCLTPP